MFTLGLSSKKRLGPIPRSNSTNDEQWYIPYNGPYEAPPPPRIRKARDSWGDPIDDYAVGPVAGDSDVDVGGMGRRVYAPETVANEGVRRERKGSEVGKDVEDEEDAEMKELHKRYGGGYDEFKYGTHGAFDANVAVVESSKGRRSSHTRGFSFGGDEERERGRSPVRTRDRAFSVVSTTSSGALDPGRTSFSSASMAAYPQVFGRGTTVSSANPPVLPSYISLDGMSIGGVGESPMPLHGRRSKRQGSKDSGRKSLASIFTFGAKMRGTSPARSIEGGKEKDGQSLKRSSTQKTTPSKGYGRQVDRSSLTRRDSNSSTSTPISPPGVGVAGPSRSYSPFSTSNAVASGVIPRGATPHTTQSNRVSPNNVSETLPGAKSNHDSLTTDEEDYYNSYYAMLERGPEDEAAHSHPYLSNTGARHRQSPSGSQDSKQLNATTRQSSTSPHKSSPGYPYAYNHPTDQPQQVSYPALDLSTVDESRLTNSVLSPPASAPPSSGLGFSAKHPYSTSYHPYEAGPRSMPSTSPNPNMDTPTFTVPTYNVTQPPNTAVEPEYVHPYAAVERAPSPARGVGSVGLNLGLGTLSAFGRRLRNSTSTPNLRVSKHVQVVSPSGTSVSGSSNPSSPGLAPVESSKTFVSGGLNGRNVPGVYVQTSQSRPTTSTSNAPFKIKDRWLAAETWCDALLFPRPRLKVRALPESTSPSPPGEQTVFSPSAISPGSAVDVGVRLRSPSADPFAAPAMGGGASSSLQGLPPTPGYTGSGRIVSPPGSPLWLDEVDPSNAAVAGPSNPRGKVREPGVASRVLAHSRSLVDMRNRGKLNTGYPNVLPKGMTTEAGEGISRSKSARARGKEKEFEGLERPKSFALDDLDLPTPVPSLANVLAEGKQLDEDRQAWQAMATKSFGNKRARSLSRTRAKSLTRKGRANMMAKSNSTNATLDGQGSLTQQGHMEYLAAQACLGNQNIALTPNVEPPKLSFLSPVTSPDTSHATGTTVVGSSRTGHSHSNSHATSTKTVANKPSRTTGLHRSQTHSRTNSRTVSSSGTHSRNDSWSKTAAVRVAKICGDPGIDIDMDYVGVHSGASGGIGTERIGAGYGMDDDRTALLGGHNNGLESALRRDGTKVIRLADPAHIPIDKGIPVSHSLPPPLGVPTTPALHPYNAYHRETPSPALSTADSKISESKVGIALGTPPSEEALQITSTTTAPVTYTITHPYAQGLTSYTHAASVGPSSATTSRPGTADHHLEFAGPHPSIVTPGTAAVLSDSSGKAAPISDILARHKLAPHLNMVMHPYAKGGLSEDSSAKRDSYLDANGLVGQYRSEDPQPHPDKMWAQLSPGVVREVLDRDLQYSPFLPNAQETSDSNDFITPGTEDVDSSVRMEKGRPQGWERERLLSIHDTAGVAEALVNASRYGLSEDLLLPGSEAPDVRPVVEKPVRRPVALANFQQPSDPISNHTLASSRLNSSLPDSSLGGADQPDSLSQITTGTGSSSPHLRPLGSPNDLENFQDLFYRPSTRQERRTPKEAALPDTPSPASANVTWDVAMKHRQTGSGLTSLARQLSEDMEALALENGRQPSSYAPSQRSSVSFAHTRSHSMGSISYRGSIPYPPYPLSRRPTEGSLQFVFEEMSPTSSVNVDMANAAHVFESSALPEDVQSSRASSLMEHGDLDEDEFTTNLRLGMVASLTTPPIVSSERRFSFNGQTVMEPNDEAENDDTIRTDLARISSPLRQEITGENSARTRPPDAHAHTHPHVRSLATHSSSPHARVRVLSNSSSLRPHDGGVRASYMTTTSDASRMSGLSDFPTPPTINPTPQHVAYLTSYFDDDFRSRDKSTGSLQPPIPSTAATIGSNRSSLAPSLGVPSGVQTLHPNVEFGDNQSAAELAKTLSSPSPQP